MNTEERLSAYLEYFKTAKFPPVPFRINTYMSITDTSLFISRQADSIRNSRNTDVGREVCFRRMEELKAVCEGQ